MNCGLRSLTARAARRADEGQFYTAWRRENPTKLGEPYTFIETTGRGHLVGVILQAQGFESGKTLFFEGDDETTVDGELVVRGTGSEDFFNGGWYACARPLGKADVISAERLPWLRQTPGTNGVLTGFLSAMCIGLKRASGRPSSTPVKRTAFSPITAALASLSEGRPSVDLTPLPLNQRAVADLQEIVFPAWWQLPIAAWSFEHATLSRKKKRSMARKSDFFR